MELEERNGELLESKNVVMRIEGLTVWTPDVKSWWRRKVTKPKAVILDNVSASIAEGEFVAVLGPSGAGKTTLLVSMAGRCTLPRRGRVSVGGCDVTKVRAVEILPQFDVFMDRLTVMEHLVFMTELKLGSCKNAVNRDILNTLLWELKLKAHAKTSIRSLSGGERRVLSLATSLLSRPQILICDEPTTGLDSYNAALVVDSLKKLTLQGKVVVCSVHQPSTDLFRAFSSLMLMAEGKLVFHGSQDDCKDFFESINLRCPTNYNPAEFYIRAVSRLDGQDHVARITESYRDQLSRSGTSSETDVGSVPERYRRNWFKQVQLLLWRTCLTMRRDLKGQLLQLFCNVMASSLVIATCYVGVSGTTQRGIQDMRGLMWLMTSEVSFALSYNALYAFEAELTLFKREVGIYNCSAYFVARFLGFIPNCVVWPLTLICITTAAVELPNRIITALELLATLCLSAVAATAYGLGMSALFTSSGIMGDVMPCADLPLFLMSGAFLRLSSLPMWLYPIRYVSHFYYSMDAISNIYWRQIAHIDCDTNSTSMCVSDGLKVLSETGYSLFNFALQDGLGLTLIIIMWSILAYLGLRKEQRKGYAY